MTPALSQELAGLPVWALGVGALVWAALVVAVVPLTFRLLILLARRAEAQVAALLLRAARGPAKVVLLLLGVGIALESATVSDRALRYGRATIFSLVAISIVVFVDRAVRGLLDLYFPKSGALQTGRPVIVGAVRGLLIGVGILTVLGSLGVSITPILASLGVGSLAVALALQDTLAQLFAGIYMTADQPVRAGDYVRLDSGEEGIVEKIGWRSTRLRMLQNNLVVIPNAKLAGSSITNFHLPVPEMSLVIPLGVAYGSDLERVDRVVKEVAREVLSTIPGGVADWEPLVRFQEFADSGINLAAVLRVAQFSDQHIVRSEFIRRVHARFAEEGIVIPYPVRDLRLGSEERDALRGGGAEGRGSAARNQEG